MRQVNDASAPGPKWRLILHDAGSPVWNMAVDEAVFDAVGSGLAPPTLRLYRWDRVAVSVGRFQSVPRTVDTGLCEALGVPIVRRPTGGRGVLHGGDQTLSICARSRHLGVPQGKVAAVYGALLAGIADGLRPFGVTAAPAQEERRSEPAGDCFAVRSAADLVTPDGIKVAGAAMRRRADGVLLQASVVHRAPAVAASRIFLGPPASARYPLRDVPASALEQGIVEGYRHALGVHLEEGELTGWELERAGALMVQFEALEAGVRVDRGMPL